MVLVPSHVPVEFISMYLPAIYAALIVGFIGSMAIALNRRDIHILILTDLIGLAMIIIVSAVILLMPILKKIKAVKKA